MRPLQIEMTNFGPYRHEVINFEHLSQDPVFLISGDTGSGKSMVFDAMTVALFYSTASDRDVKSLRSSFATVDDPLTEITFYFEHSDHIYCVHRVIEQDVKKVRGKGLKKQGQKVELSLVERPGGEVIRQIASKPNEVGAAINDLLQMNAEQFKQIILLPQNKFSEFLKANTKDKIPILRTIFGTQIFDQFMLKLAERQKLTSESRKERSTQLNILYRDKVWENVAEQLEQTPENEKLQVIESSIKQYQDDLSELEKVYQANQKQIEKQEKELRQAQAVNEKFNQLHLAEEDYQKQIIDKAEDYRGSLKQRQQLEFAKDLEETVKKIERSKQTLVENEKGLEKLINNLSTLEDEKDKLNNEGHLLDERADELSDLPSDIKQWNLEREQAKQVDVLTSQLVQKKALLNQLKQTKEEAGAKLEQSVKALDELKASEIPEKQLLERERQLAHLEDLFTNRINVLHQQYVKQKNEKKDLSDKIRQISSSLESINQLLSEESDRLESKKADRRALMVAQLRAELVDGEACVVCGSTEHPFATEHVQADEQALKQLLEEVEKLEQNVSEIKAEYVQEEAHLSHQESLYAVKSKEIEESETELHHLIEHFMGDLTNTSLFPDVEARSAVDAEKVATILQDVTVTLSKERENYDELQAKKAGLEEAIDQQNQDLQALASTITTEEALEKKLGSDIEVIMIKVPRLEKVDYYDKEIANGEKLLTAYQKDRDAYHQAQQKLELNETKLLTMKKTFEENIERFGLELKASRKELADSLASEQALTHDEVTLGQWLEELDSLQIIIKKLATYETKKADLEEQIKKLKLDLDQETEKNLTSLEETLEVQTQAQRQRLVEKTSLSQLVESQQLRYQQLSDLLAQEEEAREEGAAIDNLANFVKGGATGQVRLNLVTYVLREYLQEVIEYANNRFYKELTDGRYLLELHSVEASGNGQVGLDMDVRDLTTDVSRPVSTLSGGETFVTALAIALSLSEIVQSKTNGATIEALFVDEGFGTLDKEALDRAMKALEDVGQNKMVGVISHVEEMKSRIGQQLQVRKHHDGSSELKVYSFY